MKVLQLAKFFAPFDGGIETAVRGLTEGLHASGLKVDVLCCNTDRSTQRETFPPGYSVTRAASWGRMLSTSIAPALMREMLDRRSRYDVIHIHMPDPMAALALRVSRPKSAVVVHWHSDVIRQKLSLKLYEPLQQWLLDRADAVIATSEPYAATSPVLNRWRHKVSVIPLGVRDMSSAAPTRPLVPRRPFVLAVGRMAHYKGFDTLIEAARLLPSHVSVVIVGGGELLSELRARVRSHGLEGRVHMPGRVADDEVAALMAACDVFCMPSTSRAEAFGIAMAEAMAFGKPVVATNIPGSGVPWVSPSGETGLNVPPGDAQALAQALSQLITEPDFAQKLGQAARHRFLREFDAQQMTDRTVALYEHLLAQRCTGRTPTQRSAVGYRRLVS